MDWSPPRLYVVGADTSAQQTFEGMIEGFAKSMQARGLANSTVARSVWMARYFHAFTGTYPWEWTPSDVQDFTSAMLSGRNQRAHSTLRGYHHMLRSFCGYLASPAHDWHQKCIERFGTAPAQICFPWNTFRHLSEFEARPARRPFSYDELETFFFHADDVANRAAESGRKGALTALRDSQFFKTVYAFGLRRREAVMLDLEDLRSNPEMPSWGSYGKLHVRFGKSLKGSPPRRRTIIAVPEFEWAIEGLRMWVEQARPQFGPVESRAIWLSERRDRIATRLVDYRFAMIRDRAGLDQALTLHSLRHSYVTHMIEFGYAERFVQEQVGHAYASTTAIYTSVSDDFKNRVFRSALERLKPEEGKSRET